MKEITIDGTVYVPKGSETNKPAKSLKGLKYVIVRTYSAGVFAGYLKDLKGQEGTVLQARRIWYWKGAASLSQLAVDGTSEPNECKFPCEVESIQLTNIIEVLSVTQKAQDSINNVPVWKE